MTRRNRSNRPIYFYRQPKLVVEQLFIPAGPRILASLFPVRVLVGWLKKPDDIGYLGGEHRVKMSAEEAVRYRQLIRTGNQALSRLPKLVQGTVVSELAIEYERHAVRWRSQPQAQPYIDEGWEMMLVRLNNIVSLQPLVSLDKCDSLMSVIHPTDFDALASLVLPVDRPSYLQVAGLGGRYVLRDGYHRAYSLLRSGVSIVPALVRNVPDLAALTMPPGTFARVLDLDRPPTLSDFLHSRLAATIR